MSGHKTDSCCSLRDCCLIFVALILGMFAMGEVWSILSIFDETRDSWSISIGSFIICTSLLIVIVGLIVGILKKRRWLLLVFLIVFGIYNVVQIIGIVFILVLIVIPLKGVPMPETAHWSMIVIRMAFIILALAFFMFLHIWGWWSVLLLFRKMTKGPTGEMKMSLIPSVKPFTDEVDDVEMGNETP